MMNRLPNEMAVLGEYRQFIAYELRHNKEQDNKLVKIPCNYKTGKQINARDSQNWTDFNTAAKSAQQLGDSYGIGFVLTKDDPLFCLDIDECLINGALDPLYNDIVDRLEGCFIEISKSGKGLHVWGSYDFISPHRSVSVKKINNKPVELYTDKRFIALTGNVWLNHKGSAAYDATQPINGLISEYFTQSVVHNEAQDWTDEPHPDWAGYSDDKELIEAALKSRSAKNIFAGQLNFYELWTCNVDAIAREFPPMKSTEDYDASRADAALAQHLAFWCGNDCGRMLRLMHMSGLKREKWEREDYLQRTILNAVNRQTQFHSKKGISKPEENVVQNSDDQPQPNAIKCLSNYKLGEAILTLEELRQTELPERKLILPWLPEGGLAMVFAKRGLGKTHFSLSLAVSITSHETFMRWQVKNGCGVLYVDGEMSLGDIKNRLIKFTPLTSHLKHTLKILSHEIFFQKFERDLSLTDGDFQNAILTTLDTDKDIKLVVFDNLSSLSRIKENESDEWRHCVLPFLIACRRRGVAILLVHHTAKSGDQRGTGAREDQLDTSIKLESVIDAKPDEGCQFKLSFSKSRGCYGNDVAPFVANLCEIQNEYCWEISSVEESTKDKLMQLIADCGEQGITVTEAAKELEVSKGMISRLKGELEKEGCINPSTGKTPMKVADNWKGRK